MLRETILSHRRLLFAILLVLAMAGCGTEQEQSTSGRSVTGQAYTPPENPPPAPEPVRSPPLEEEPAGKIIEVGHGPEGVVADPETGLVAVGLGNPDRLALISGESGEVVREVELPESPRHLDLAAPGGPVLVPSERSDSLAQVGLPDGEISSETPVGEFPHDAASAPGGRIFVVNEFGHTASVIENDRVIETLETPLQPGGVAVTEDGLVGVVGVRGLALEVYDADTLKSLGRIDAGEGPTHIVAGPGNRFYVADTRGDAILIYGARPGLELLDRVPLPGGSPYGISIDSERNHLWVTLTAENRVVRITLNGDKPRETASYPTVRQPNSVAVDPASGRVFVAGRPGGELQIIGSRPGE